MNIVNKILLILNILILMNLQAQYAMAQESKADLEFIFAQKLSEDKLYILAAEQYQAFVKKYPNNANADDALFLSGEAYLTAENYHLAFTAYKELEMSYPLSDLIPKGRFQMAQCQVKLKNFEAAAKLFQRIPVFHPESELAPKAYLEAGHAYLKAGKSSAAMNIFFKLIGSYPDSPEQLEAHLEIVHIYMNKGEFDEAINHVDGLFRVLGPDSNEPRVYFLRAQIFEKLGQVVEAQSIYMKLISDYPNSEEAHKAHYELANLFKNNGNYEQALEYFDKYITNSISAEQLNLAYLKKGDILFSQKKYDAALDNYQQADSLSFGRIKLELKFKIAKVLTILENYNQAKIIFNQIISDKSYVDLKEKQAQELVEKTYFGLMNVLLKINHFGEALKLIQNYSERFADSPKLADMSYKKAVLFEKYIKDYTRALRAYDEFLEIFPLSPEVDEAQLALARCYENLSQYDIALNEYNNYLKRFPAGEGFEWVKNRKRVILETMNFDTPEGLNGVSHLLGKFFQGQNNVNWSFELGKVFFEIKDFNNAIERFRNLIATTDQDDIAKDEIYFYLGNAYFKLAEKSSLFNQKEAAVAYFDSAAIYLNILQDNKADSGWAEKAYYLLTQIELTRLITPEDRQSNLLELKIEWQNRFPESKYLDFILIRFADAIMATSSEDTAQIQQALNVYHTILKKFPESSYYEEAQYQEAVALHHLGSDSVAMQKLKAFVDSNPKSQFLPNALFLIAKLEKKNVNYTSAIQYLERILTEFYYSSLVTPTQLELAEIYFQMGKFQSAIDYYQSIQSSRNAALAMDGKYKGYAIIFKEAQAYESLGQYANALKKYITFVHDNPEHELSPQAMLAIARISQKQHNLTFAKEYYQNILKHSTQSEYQYTAHLSLGDIFFRQELYEEANSHYLTAQKMASKLPQEKYPASQSIRGKYKLKQFNAADADAKMFMKKFKDSKHEEAQFLQDKGNAYIAEKKFDLAEKTFKKLKDNFKNTDFAARGEFGLGAVYLITNHTEEALKLLTNIPSKYPDSEVVPLTYFNLGDFYYKSQQIENAINAFKQILGHPKAGDFYQKALNYLIKCYSDLKLWDQAIALTREYLNKYPTSKDSFNKKVELAKFLMYLKEYNRAIARFKQLQPFADDETYTEIQFYIGQSYKEMGNFNRAASEYLKVKYLTRPTKLPWHVTAQFEASKCLIRLGKTEQAKIILQRIINEQGVDSNFGRFAKQKLEELEKADSPIVEKDTY